jgi:hypothetical protein
MSALLRVKPTASGFTDQVFLILARFTPSSLPALFQGFWILTLISTLGSWGYPPVVDFWDFSAKMCVFVFFAASFTPIAPPHAGLYSEPLFLESLWHQAELTRSL